MRIEVFFLSTKASEERQIYIAREPEFTSVLKGQVSNKT